MSYRIGSINWFEHMMQTLGFLVVGIEYYHSSKIQGLIPRKDEKKNVYYFGILISTSPEEDTSIKSLGYEDVILRNLDKDIYELRFRIVVIPERHLLIPAAQGHDLFELPKYDRSNDHLIMIKDASKRYLFESN